MQVGLDLEPLWQAFKIVMPGLKCANNCKHLLVIDLVVALCVRHGLRVIRNWVPLAIILQLRQYISCCVT